MKIFLLACVFVMAPVPAVAAPPALPDLYPNAYYRKVGQEQARKDINACRTEALDYDAAADKPGAAGNAARGALKGAAKGALAGTIINGKAGRGAGAGAALGGLNSAGNSLRQQRDGTPEYRNYVEACLEDKGYKVVGWK